MGIIKSTLNILGVLSPVHFQFWKLTSGSKFVGEDSFGNKYYEAPPRKGYKHNRRTVDYKGAADASKVPPEWHAWLHHQTDVFPALDAEQGSYRRPWQKPYEANQTGTENAYMPPGHQLKGGQRDKASGDYEAWTPPE